MTRNFRPRALLAAALAATAVLSSCSSDPAPSPAPAAPSQAAQAAPSEPTSAAPAPTTAPPAAPVETPAPTPTPAVATPPDPRPFSQPAPLAAPIRPGQTGALVRELQIRLRHAKSLALYDSTEMFGGQTQGAVVHFQQAHGLPATGVVDQATWDALRGASHDPTPEEMTNTNVGPWYVGPTHEGFIKELQHRLQQLGLYAGAINGFLNAETKGAIGTFRNSVGLPTSEVMDERTYNHLLPKTVLPAYNQLFEAPPANELTQDLDPRCTTGKVICISMEQKKMSLVNNGQILLTREARFGMPGYETELGDFRIWFMKWDTVSTIFGERTPMPYAIFYNRDAAVHFSDAFADTGYAGGSHGCSQTKDYQFLKWVYENVAVGDRVVVY